MSYRNDDRTATIVVLVVGSVSLLISLAVAGTTVYVAYHFISKIW